ncbi:glucose-1-phosphate cytidylyltransferase [Prochlorococcus marinus]|uniref:glucose-1-phosphate cytidylyltransferase n=1 Tax=Prochlorococcus marinus TaxID=1219 RepID=UPI001ADB7720|nr:glucose-1-phosphate cytidylyltransferase [Prochlorococcus marinus]MBO8219553.1 glucose-1-phosphate cytidylyltransferase [Prochlorococcus marinus CUG1416]MBW3051924.1 glucose-1-phosphate cytidylyltransferase [Prochlorococcus marinus str. MU1416]
MKAVILAGGLGTRISEETHIKPKPMIEIGGMPIIWHIMKFLSSYEINEFIICLGYKGYVIKEYFSNYSLHSSDVTIDLKHGSTEVHAHRYEPWRISLIDTGLGTQTGGRLKRLKQYLEMEDDFLFTYGDGLADININLLKKTHIENKTLATVTAVAPPGRYGAIKYKNNKVTGFAEKPAGDGGRINGGFFILKPEVIDLIENDSTPWESEPLEKLIDLNQLGLYNHNGFWHPLDTLRDKRYLEGLWQKNQAPWKLWK